ncbi:MAG: hypothetical protein FD133_1479 [Erysipelotrichaceae bacterium]|nr:MAG: hypothetical protein FD179_1720 [Erysipelotrichaceae bacterium]TXT17239.1 MAG: hypothetical protein FD133_1479 [Erysipelotrichaceae bacterium]
MAKNSFAYLDKAIKLLNQVQQNEKESIQQGSSIMAKTIQNGNSIFVFGASHAGILTEEAYFRAGGLVVFNPIFAKGLLLDNSPITITSQMERLEGYGKIIIDKTPIKPGDCLIVHSVSGRNAATIEVAMAAKVKGAYVIAITNLAYSKSVTSRYSKGVKLYEVVDLVIDNHGDIGDAAIDIGETGITMGATSTVVGAAILNTLATETIMIMHEAGVKVLPVFYSANLDGGEAKNKLVVETYKNQIHYEFD